MFPEQRMDIIKKMLQSQKHVDISSMSAALRVSDVTVRKYLDVLEKQGYLTKVHGGAVWIEQQDSPPSVFPKSDDRLESIGDFAATLVDASDSIFIGPGITCSVFAKHISRFSDLSVMTNNFQVLGHLVGNVSNLSFVGGEVAVLENGSTYTFGSRSEIYFSNMAIGKAFIGCDGLDTEVGITAHSLSLTDMAQQIMKISRELYVLGASTKFGKVALNRICSLSRPDGIVTDHDISDSYKQYCYEHNIKLLIAYGQL